MHAQETNFYIAILITAVVLGIIIVFFVVFIVRQQRENLRLYKNYIIAEMTVQEKERARIASDLHDDLGPMLSGVKMRISSFELIDKEDGEQRKKTNALIDEILKRLREISFDLMPGVLITKGFVTSLKEFVSFINNNTELKIELVIVEVERMLPEHLSIQLYRIMQEVIRNTLKHAGASRLLVELKIEKNALILSFLDNGIGFNYERESQKYEGLGLRNLLMRTDIIGGVLFIESKLNVGTSYTFEIPI